MKKIYTLAIALMSGVILTACVGAVNLSAGTIAGAKTKNTDSSPIVLTPESILINRCIIGNTAQADPTCAKAVADTNGCITDPFSSGCEVNPLFSPHVQNARDERVKFCNDADNAGDNHCTGSDSVSDICTHDVFSRVCDDNIDYYSPRETECKNELTSARCESTISRVCDADPLNAVFCFGSDFYNGAREMACTSNTTRVSCRTTVRRVCDADPFNTDLCFIRFSRDASYLYSLNYHGMRESICESEPTSPRCKTTVTRVCDTNAFNGLCDNNPIYENERIADCITFGNMILSRCTDLFDEDSCVQNPFDASCATNMNFITHVETARVERIGFCSVRANASNDVCNRTLERPNTATFLQIFEDPLVTFLNKNGEKNEFLHSTTTSINRSDIYKSRGQTLIVNFSTLNLATGNGNQILGGDKADGVASFRLKNTSPNLHYAEIFPSTDLGLPRTETSGTAQWAGRFSSSGGFNVNQNFMLTVNFSEGEQAGTISASIQYSDDISYSLTGVFDTKGVIRGDIERVIPNSRIPGTLRGLIGQEGVVGVFISNVTSDSGYSGGFVAKPPSE